MVDGIHRNSKQVIQYDKIEYGSNIRFQDVAGVKEIDLSRTKHKCVLFTMSKEDCLSSFKKRMFIIDSKLELISGSTRMLDSSSASGVVLLCLTVYKESKNTTVQDEKFSWGRLLREMARISKPNIMDSPHFSHSESSGLYYGFGNRGRFKIVNNSSVGLYVNKKSCNVHKQEEINDSASLIEKMISVELKNSINTFSSIVPNVKMLISHVLDVA